MVMGDEEILREWRLAKEPGAYLQVLADLNCVSKAQMRRHLESLGVEVPKGRPGRPSFDTDLARRMLSAGATDGEVAQAVGVSRRAVCSFRARNGIPVNSERMDRTVDPEIRILRVPPERVADREQRWAVTDHGRTVLYLRTQDAAQIVRAAVALDRRLAAGETADKDVDKNGKADT